MLDFNAQGIIANKHKRKIKDIDLLFLKNLSWDWHLASKMLKIVSENETSNNAAHKSIYHM